MSIDKWLVSEVVEKAFEWRKWADKIPFIKWPSDWEVKAVPPFTGAIIRYIVKTPKAEVSIYLDCYDMLGYFGQPYWEVYPVHDNNERCAMNDVAGLLKLIELAGTEPAKSEEVT